MASTARMPSSSESSTKSLDETLSAVQGTDSRTLSWYRSSGVLNRRKHHRVAFPQPLYVVGLELNTDTGQYVAVSEPMMAKGRDISVEGISIQHKEPLPHRYVAVCYRSETGIETLVASFLWCRFAREGHYVSGGRFTREPQLSAKLEIDWNSLPSTRC